MTDKKTIRVRIAVAVSAKGNWCASGWKDSDGSIHGEDCVFDGLVPLDTSNAIIVFVEADVPLPESVTIEGKVQP